MSIHFSLLVAGPTPFATLSKQLCDVPEFHQEGEDISAPGLLVHLGKPSPLTTATVEEEFGFTPSSSATFRWYSVDDPVATRIHLIRGCMELLKGKADDAVLLLNGETVIFLRRNGLDVLNPVEGFWTKEVLALVPKTFECKALRGI